MNAIKCKDLDCKYNSINSYLTNLFDRCNSRMEEVDDLVEAYEESQRELEECSRRDWPIIKQSQGEICRRIVELYIKKKAGR